MFSWLLLFGVVGLRWGLTLLAWACAFHGFLLSFLIVSTGFPLRLFVSHGYLGLQYATKAFSLHLEVSSFRLQFVVCSTQLSRVLAQGRE